MQPRTQTFSTVSETGEGLYQPVWVYISHYGYHEASSATGVCFDAIAQPYRLWSGDANTFNDLRRMLLQRCGIADRPLARKILVAVRGATKQKMDDLDVADRQWLGFSTMMEALSAWGAARDVVVASVEFGALDSYKLRCC